MEACSGQSIELVQTASQKALILQSSLAVGEYFAEYIKKGPNMAALTNQSTVRAV